MELTERVRDGLRATTRFGDVTSVAEAGSTNRLVAQAAAAGAPEGLVVTADHQTAGRGRLDRSWEDRPGDGLLVSVLLRPDLPMPSWHLVTAAVALAAQDACETVAGVRTEIKWPNDLLAGGLKLAGVLAETVGTAVVVGMGLNVHGGPPGAAFLDGLAGRRVSREALLVEWLERLEWNLGDWGRVGREYRSRCGTVGRAVAVDMAGGRRTEGRAEAVDDHGRLLVREPGGRLEAVSAADVVHLRW